MSYASKVIATLACAFVLVMHGTPRAEEASVQILKPMSGPAAGRTGHQYLLNMKIGGKQAVSYFLSEGGRCRLTVMVADAVIGDDVPNMTTVRFDTAIQAGSSAQFGTADGKALNFACDATAEAVTVGSYDAAHPPGT